MEQRLSRITGNKDLEDTCLFLEIYFRFFKTLDWEEVYHKKLKPPILPKVKSDRDPGTVSAEVSEIQVKKKSLDLFGNFRRRKSHLF